MKLSEIDPLFWVAISELMKKGYKFDFKMTIEVDINSNMIKK